MSSLHSVSLVNSYPTYYHVITTQYVSVALDCAAPYHITQLMSISIREYFASTVVYCCQSSTYSNQLVRLFSG